MKFLINKIPRPYQSSFSSNVSKILEEERAPYKIINGSITQITSEVEACEVEKALQIDDKYRNVKKHLHKALDLYSKRPTPDFKNSIKDSVLALEALARIILNNKKATLGELADSLPTHTAFKEAIKKLYGWTSDENGIRHSEKGTELAIGPDEARFLLIICSAFINYIIAKHG